MYAIIKKIKHQEVNSVANGDSCGSNGRLWRYSVKVHRVLLVAALGFLRS